MTENRSNCFGSNSEGEGENHLTEVEDDGHSSLADNQDTV